MAVEGEAEIRVPGYNKPLKIGRMYDFYFPPADTTSSNAGAAGGLVISTTRPETMAGDVAVAVHPDDSRYTHLYNRTLRHPLTGRAIPVVTDSDLVDPEFGTGAVKLTPGTGSRRDRERGARV